MELSEFVSLFDQANLSKKMSKQNLYFSMPCFLIHSIYVSDFVELRKISSWLIKQ